MKTKVVMITGALGDIGRSLALEFARPGAALALCDLHPEASATPLLDELKRSGAATTYRRVNVTDDVSMAACLADVARDFEGPDICIANAGIVERGDLVDLPVQAWRRTMEVNLTGGFITAQSAARCMIAAQRKGHIVFIGSWVQDMPRANIGAYCASKSGLKMLAKCLALELAPRGIRVNVVAPGWVDAGLTSHNLQRHPELRSQMESQIPLGQFVSAQDFARTVRLLCSEDAGYITGTTLLVDGGASLCPRKG